MKRNVSQGINAAGTGSLAPFSPASARKQGSRFPTVVAVLVASLTCVPPTARGQAASPLALVDYQLMSSVRADRTRFDYTYRVTIRNTSAAIATLVTGSVTSTAPATMVVDGSATFGAIAPGTDATSFDTITIRQDRLLPFNSAILQWTFSSATFSDVTGATPPADPGPAGDLTLSGIDTNVNGVRDDVERWILLEFATAEVRGAFFDHARVLQSALAEAHDVAGARRNGAMLVRSVRCLYEVTNGAGKASLDELVARFVNTRARLDAYLLFGLNMEGQVYTLASTKQLSSCDSEIGKVGTP